MENIREFKNVTVLSQVRDDKEEKMQMDPACSELVNKVFYKFLILCRGFDTLYADRKRLNAEKTQWTETFQKLGYKNEEDIKHALDKLQFLSFPNPPQLGEFLEWCKPSFEDMRKILGIPDLDDSYTESCKNGNPSFAKKWSHEFVSHVAEQTGLHFLTANPREKTYPLFKHNYLLCAEKMINGTLDLAPLQKALSQETEKFIDREKADVSNKNCMELVRRLRLQNKK